jgi:hypothetical protein
MDTNSRILLDVAMLAVACSTVLATKPATILRPIRPARSCRALPWAVRFNDGNTILSSTGSTQPSFTLRDAVIDLKFSPLDLGTTIATLSSE